MRRHSGWLAALLVLVLATVVLAEIRVGGVRSSGRSEKLGSFRSNPYYSDSIHNPFGAGSPYKADGLMNPYGRYGSEYSSRSWTNPYATQAPRLYQGGRYRGRLSSNPYDADSTSNRFGRYGSPYSADSINNPFGAGNVYGTTPVDVYPGD